MASLSSQGARVLGIRHHGPGSARAVQQALSAHNPNIVLIEGPPEADGLIEWVGRGLQPPVALLVYDVANPARAAYWPYAAFSPEWQAMQWAVTNKVPVRFIDQPAAVTLALTDAESRSPKPPKDHSSDDRPPDGPTVRDDPMALLARAAGHSDPERWWEDAVESVAQGDIFTSLTEAMAELRDAGDPAEDDEDARREAFMRTGIRSALRTHDNVAVVCGAWHTPALIGPQPSATADKALTKGLPKVKVATAWIPWTHSRLAYASGYGAGIASPGWYQHLFATSDAVVERWFTAVAGVLRNRDLPISSAHVIEATRLAQALAGIRGRPLPGLDEVQEAALAVMCDGNESTLAVVTHRLVVGEELGTVPEGSPLVPLDADLRRQAKTRRLAMSATAKNLVLDLRSDYDRERSRLLHRLAVLDVNWGVPARVSGTGSFKEGWVLEWSPDFSVAIVLAAAWGTTVKIAATSKLTADIGPLADVTARIEQALLAELTDALPVLLAALDDRTAHEHDIARLLEALPALVRAQRYGTVRGTDTTSLRTVARVVLTRAAAGLPAAAGGQSAEAATALAGHIDAVTDVVGLLPEGAVEEWYQALHRTVQRGDVPAFLAGRLTRTLLDGETIAIEQARTRLAQALTHRPTVTQRAEFAEGFVSGSALLLIHDRQVLAIVDAWMTKLNSDEFIEVLPMLRRAFGRFNRPERTAIAERAARLHTQASDEQISDELPYAHMRAALDTVAELLRGDDE